MVFMASGVALHDEPAERGAKNDGAFYFEGSAKRDDVVRPRVEAPAIRRAVVAASVAALVEHDDLRELAEQHRSLEAVGGVEARAAVDGDDRWALDESRPVRDALRPEDLEPQ